MIKKNRRRRNRASGTANPIIAETELLIRSRWGQLSGTETPLVAETELSIAKYKALLKGLGYVDDVLQGTVHNSKIVGMMVAPHHGHHEHSLDAESPPIGRVFVRNHSSNVTDESEKSPPSPRVLKAFRLFLPRNQRDEIDLIIADLAEDVREMQTDNIARWKIRSVLLWHTVTTVSAYLCCGAKQAFKAAVPVAALWRLLQKLSSG